VAEELFKTSKWNVGQSGLSGSSRYIVHATGLNCDKEWGVDYTKAFRFVIVRCWNRSITLNGCEIVLEASASRSIEGLSKAIWQGVQTTEWIEIKQGLIRLVGAQPKANSATNFY